MAGRHELRALSRVPPSRSRDPQDRLVPEAAEDFTDAEAIAAIARTTNANFRLLDRLFAQIQRILEINRLQTITAEVVDAARETLVIGQT